MYKKVNITENHLRIISLFTAKNKDFYIREVTRLLGISPRTAQLILDNLEKKGILRSDLRGNVRIYKLNDTQLTKHYLKLAEEYKTTCMLSQHPELLPLAEALKETAFVTSYKNKVLELGVFSDGKGVAELCRKLRIKVKVVKFKDVPEEHTYLKW